ncbi:uncharacterized protein LOC127713890 [Mytilus californianus]|uniref:uncharacterized protein LOC127713890 n=1 Tax=Mytilus californianus TaxID=6549 RepID=UPI0022454660|nr:uncharacterized protein LOC127713890 [Mytilus californianus]
MDLIDNFEKRWHEALCLMERDFPAALQTFFFHLLHHLPQYIRLYGPPRNFWMFPNERFNHTLTEAVSNNQYPELSAIKKVEVQWLITLLNSAGFFRPIKVEAAKLNSLLEDLTQRRDILQQMKCHKLKTFTKVRLFKRK